MARSTVCSSMNKQQTTTKQTYHDHFKLKGPFWDIAGNQFSNNNRRTEEDEDEEQYHRLMGTAAGFPWPPRCYTCSFCKREFRSAQALGGHMNVHRRDRARLRQYSPPLDDTNTNNSPLNLNLDPNNPSLNYPPNPNSRPRDPSPPPLPPPSPPPLSSLLTKFPQFSTTLPPLSAEATNMVRRPIVTKDFIKMNKGSKGVFGVEKVSSYVHEKVCEKAEEFVGLDLEIGLIRQAEEEVLDLELRLGYT